MKFDEIYRGYRIVYRETSVHAALIWPPHGKLGLADIPQATRDEGFEVLRARTIALIDADIEKHVLAKRKPRA